MKRLEIKMFTIKGMLLTFGLSSVALATSTDVVLDLEGNPGCSQLVENSVITETRDNAPGGTRILTVADTPYQCITYTLAGTNITSWGTSYCPGSGYGADPEMDPPIKPVNMLVYKAKGSAGARVWHYGATGTVGDGDLEGPGDATSVAFCTGLNDVVVAAPAVKDCDSLAADGGTVNGVKALCDALNGDQATVHVVRRNPTTGVDTIDSCTCNRTAYECDPALPPGVYKSCIQSPCPADDPDTAVDEYAACMAEGGHTAEELLLRQVPGIIKHINNGSFYCTDFSGSLSCASFGAFGF